MSIVSIVLEEFCKQITTNLTTIPATVEGFPRRSLRVWLQPPILRISAGGLKRRPLSALAKHLPSMKLIWWKVLLLIYTLGRIAGGIINALLNNRYDLLSVMIEVPLPVITGLGVFCFLARSNRFSAQSPVHLWSRRQVLLCAVFLYDFWLFDWNIWELYFVRDLTLDILTLLQIIIQIYMINVKLKALGWQRIPKCCIVLCPLASLYAAFGSVYQSLAFGPFFDNSCSDLSSFHFLPTLGCRTWHMAVLLPVVLLQASCLWYSAFRSCTWEHGWTVCCLFLNGFLALLGTGTSIWISVISLPGAGTSYT